MGGWEPTAAEVESLAGVGTWSIDVPTRAVWWSAAHGDLHGVPADAVVSLEDWAALVHPDDRLTWRAACDRVFAGWNVPVVEHRIVRGDGSERWLQCRGRVEPGPDGQPAVVRGVSLDITPHRLAGESLLAFVADAAHELRTPVDAIGLATSALEVASDADRQTVVEVLARQAARLRDLTNDLIDLTALESAQGGPVGAQVPEPVDLAGAVRDALDHAPAPEGRTVEVDVAPGTTVLATPLHVDRVLVNLLTNAYRYGGPHVRVLARSSADVVRLEVADDGDGVPADAAETIFEPFRRAGAARAGSSGLGLAIVARILRRLGGTIRYEPGGPGAVFVVELPAVR